MHIARWVLKHPVYGIVILRLGIYASRPNVSKLCSFIGSMNPSILISVILENKLLASVSCFQKICLLSTNDFCFLMTITCRPSRSFFLFSFCFMFAKTIHPSLSMRKTFPLYTYIPIHEKTFSIYTRIKKNSFSLYQHGLYKTSIPFSKISFSFFNIHSLFIQKFSLYTLIAHTQEKHIIYTHKILSYTFYIQKLFSFLYI